MFEKYKVRKTLLGAKEISEIFACDREIAKQVIAQIKTVSRIEKSKTKVDVRDYLHFTMNMSPNQMRNFAHSLALKKESTAVSFAVEGKLLRQAL
jgi:hypothetical protein